MGYPNGEVPRNLLVGRPSADKDFCLMMPGTAYKHDLMVALAKAWYGWTPVVSGSNDAYRTIDAQWYYWNTMPYPMAAYPGTSSHGGSFDGIEAGAVDYGNWSQVGVDKFFAVARGAGFEPGYYMGQFGRPYEPWHVIDRSPWFVPETPEPVKIPEDEDMRLITWNGRVWIVGFETVAYIPNEAALSAAKKITQGDPKPLSDGELTQMLLFLGIPWGAIDGAFQGKMFNNESKPGGNFWSRTMAEGDANRTNQAGLAKSIQDLANSVKK